MQISEQKLLDIIFEEIYLMENFLKPIENMQTEPIDDEVMAVIFKIADKKEVNEAPAKPLTRNSPNADKPKRGISDQFLDDDQKKSIRNLVYKFGNDADAIVSVAKKLAVPAAFIASVVGGGIAGAVLSGGATDTTSGDTVELVDQTLVPSDVYGTGWDQYEGEFADLSNAEKMKKTWTQYENSPEQRAPVSSQFSIFKYSHIPAQDISDDNILPLSGMTAGDYYQYWNQKVQQNPDVELPLLKKMVFGDVGKWSGGTGTDSNFQKADDGSNLLPPDWTVMHSLYGDIVEDKAIDLSQAVQNASPEERQQIYDSLPGVDSDVDFNKFVNDLLYSVGRQAR
tara:strand:- start:3051 stop:4070 length:1020 start_codon:yes stop_codon:yes gene_type:complete